MRLGKRQWIAFFVLLGLNAMLAFLPFAAGMQHALLAGQEMPPELAGVPGWALGAANAALILVAYGIAGTAGLWLGKRAGLPGVFRSEAGWRGWVWTPMALGLVVGVGMVIGDRVFAALGQWEGIAHPGFPISLIASATAGIGEEIVFRGFVMGLWAFLLHRLLRRPDRTKAAHWIANLVAALAFIAGHLPLALGLFNARSPLELPAAVLADVIVLNGLVALVAGERYMRDGLVAAMGVHFWADIVWHVLWPLIAR